MKIRKWFLAAAVILTIAALAGCASSGGGASAKPAPPPPAPVPEGTERLSLLNGAYGIFRFDLPAGAKWSDYGKLTAEYLVDEEHIKRPQRNKENVRLMGNYKEENFTVSGKQRIANLQDFNGPYIIDNTPRTFASMGAVADEWFTVEYDISGSKAHAQFNKANLPSPNDTGPFFLGIGIPGEDGSLRRAAIVQLVRNVTLHHRSNPALNVVSKGSGFEEPTLLSFYPLDSRREGPSDE
ncbi:MAG: hypothetical protein LBQ82_08010 [Treponema sp.]|jgi:hypothetical protein|nr:hypothetical protein [Treponema sp.]